jgi:FixJ family two-component response regulator
MTSAGDEAVAFASATEYLAWLSVGRADCLILAIHLSGMTGLEPQERLAVPAIFITAHDDAPIRARIEKSGAAGHLKKPFDAKTVLDAISRVTKGARVDQGPIGGLGDVGETECPNKEAQ